ncbi:uncharacterized protein LOC106180193 [Lingula anatina]|uniref:Uncharacterized protein LOC106180193 n=1 Tax=Lingula anatina TaxID=7574 RepID=A0A1S3KBC8_LINAN|nr:uncharacterized protein LOC106180193 [Lingula anatina]|eukprot:XP_013419561.1 uncharacterized protein LOC106180193 [Lingula anatina]
MEPSQPKLDAIYTKGRFDGHVAVVTGGASGIGRACVKRLASDGAIVAFLDVNRDAGEQLEAELKRVGSDAIYYHVDVADRDACFHAGDDIASKHGGCINYLVNCAATFLFKGLDATPSDWRKALSINVEGYSNMVQACVPHLKKAKVGIRAIVNMASVSSHLAQTDRWTYSASKAAVLQMTRCMALDLAKDGIRVNSITPGSIKTPALVAFSRIDPGLDEWLKCCHMLNRNGEPSEVAAAVAFLCSRDASFITGSDLPVDGGYAAIGPERHGRNGPQFEGVIPE